MKNLQSITRLGVAALLLSSSPVAALTIEYCSGSNTAAPDTEVTSIYQSNGRCETHCQANYAFAVLQGQSCWCSNYIPAAQVKVSDCDSSCPGYPPDLCGNPSKGLFGYIAMANTLPSGTATGTSGSTSSGNPSTTLEGSTTETSTFEPKTVTVTASASVDTTLAASASSATATDMSITTSPPISVSTIAGQPVTVTVSNSPTAAASGSSTSSGSKGSSLSGGAIAGIVIGSLIGVGAVVTFFLWYCFFSRRNDDEPSEKTGSPNGGADGSVAGGTMDTRRQSRGSQMSFMRTFAGPAGPSEQDVSTTLPTDYLNPNQAFIDNRMKKDAVLYPNGDRLSAVSLRDEEDYSRPVLRLTNPD